ncbi:hypothetical protein IW256_006368 [Actinomadura viridis]|uniref:Uncharacterized protein n=1 Tax=Actinomadura viridis TaxID=58110 RepID=A0A931GMR4_9ACTN|nr:hypothetical protein [Actinomadura viridis]
MRNLDGPALLVDDGGQPTFAVREVARRAR